MADALLVLILSPWRGVALVLLRIVRLAISVGDRADFPLARAAVLAAVMVLVAYLLGVSP